MTMPHEDPTGSPEAADDVDLAPGDQGKVTRRQKRSESVHTGEDLQRACDALIHRTHAKIDTGTGPQSRELPSLLEQLRDPSSSGVFDGSNSAKSRPTINAGIVALLIEIAAVSRRQLIDLGVARHADVDANIRAATTATIVTADVAEMDAWLYVLVKWRHAARRELQLDSGRRQWLRGVPCPQCKSLTALSRDRGDGVRMHTPALAVTWTEPLDGLAHVVEEWLWESIDCRACSASWWRGENLHHLIEALGRAGVVGPEWSAVLA